MSFVVEPIAEFYRAVLNPMQPFSALAGLPITLLDIAACFRLCLVLRQVREQLRARHDERVQSGVETRQAEDRSFTREAFTTLLIVFGGEAITAPWLGQTPSFMLTGGIPLLYVGMQAWVEFMQTVPELSLKSELPLAFLDGLSRAYLLCNLVPPAVTTHSSDKIRNSPWTLLMTALITPNAGFFVTNLLNFLQPYSLSLATPPEFLPYGWTTLDLWVAPTITALYATLTHAQPYWVGVHASLLGWTGATTVGEDGSVSIAAVDPETARATCALVLAALFAGKTYRVYGAAETAEQKAKREATAKAKQAKVKTQ